MGTKCVALIIMKNFWLAPCNFLNLEVEFKFMRQMMAKIWSTVLILSGFLSLAAFQNCGKANLSTPSNSALAQTGAVTINATVAKSNLDGCQYLLNVTDPASGQVQSYVPLKMDTSLLKDGNTVTVSGILGTDSVGTCMAGPLLQVEEAHLTTH
jgi:hypothetical protein